MKVDTPEDAIEDNEERWETFQEELVNSVNRKVLIFIFQQTYWSLIKCFNGYNGYGLPMFTMVTSRNPPPVADLALGSLSAASTRETVF